MLSSGLDLLLSPEDWGTSTQVLRQLFGGNGLLMVSTISGPGDPLTLNMKSR